MPHKFNAERRHNIPKSTFKVMNWAEYETGLRQRGSLTLWITPEAIDAWAAAPRLTPGGQACYSDSAIQTCLMLRAAFKMALRGGSAAIESSRWLIEHLLQAETTDRAMRSVSHQMHTAKFPVHRDLAGCDFEASKVDRKLIHALAEMTFTDAAHNAVLVGGPDHAT